MSRSTGKPIPEGFHSLTPSPVTIHLSVEDADAAFAHTNAAGVTVIMPVAEMFWGARYGGNAGQGPVAGGVVCEQLVVLGR